MRVTRVILAPQRRTLVIRAIPARRRSVLEFSASDRLRVARREDWVSRAMAGNCRTRNSSAGDGGNFLATTQSIQRVIERLGGVTDVAE